VVPGEYVVLVVSDTGLGMDEETKRRIFEPFFTTKEVNRGTGLGLATCYGIVKQAGGFIRVHSEVGHGTTFKVYLPRAKETPRRSSRPPVSVRKKGSETILVVEDDSAVREVAFRSLKDQGYRVLAVPSGAKAYKILQSATEEIDLLLSDVIMPHMSGPELVERARHMWPHLRVLFMSGYARGAIAHQSELPGDVELIQKPFQPEDLAAEVRRVLDAPR
jgi:CheY-like chemotaxis protein